MSGQQTSRTPPSRQQVLVGQGGLAACAAIGIGMLLAGAAWSGLLTRHEWFWPFSHAVDRRLLVIGLAILAAGAAFADRSSPRRWTWPSATAGAARNVAKNASPPHPRKREPTAHLELAARPLNLVWAERRP